jgi:uncharacterized membrane protein YhaH (DUF805 family)
VLAIGEKEGGLMVGFVDAIKLAFRQYVVWRGRATRSEYWYFFLFSILYYIVAFILTLVLAHMAPVVGAVVGGLLLLGELALILPTLSVLVRRLHDTDRSGGWYWISLIPGVGTIVLIVLLCEAGTPGPNRFGPPSFQSGQQPYPGIQGPYNPYYQAYPPNPPYPPPANPPYPPYSPPPGS